MSEINKKNIPPKYKVPFQLLGHSRKAIHC